MDDGVFDARYATRDTGSGWVCFWSGKNALSLHHDSDGKVFFQGDEIVFRRSVSWCKRRGLVVPSGACLAVEVVIRERG